MYDVLFFTLVVLYAIVSVKVDEWITISALGFKLETPLYFLSKPRYYDIVRSALFLVAILASFGLSAIPWFSGFFILAIIWLGASWIGRRKAVNNYRRILREMMDNAENAEEKAEYEMRSKQTDRELMDIVQLSMKMGL